MLLALEQRNTIISTSTSDTPLDQGVRNTSSLFVALNDSVDFAHSVAVPHNSENNWNRLSIDVVTDKSITPALQQKRVALEQRNAMISTLSSDTPLHQIMPHLSSPFGQGDKVFKH